MIYIQGTLNYGLVFSADDNSHVLSGYSDADWAGDLDTLHSISGLYSKFKATLLVGAVRIQGNTVQLLIFGVKINN